MTWSQELGLCTFCLWRPYPYPLDDVLFVKTLSTKHCLFVLVKTLSTRHCLFFLFLSFVWRPCPQDDGVLCQDHVHKTTVFCVKTLSARWWCFVWRPCSQDVGVLCEDPVHKTLVFCVKTLYTRRWCFVWSPCLQDIGVSHLAAVVWEAWCTLTLFCFVPSTGWWRTHGERSQPRLQRVLWSTHCEYKIYIHVSIFTIHTSLVLVKYQWVSAVCVCCVPVTGCLC